MSKELEKLLKKKSQIEARIQNEKNKEKHQERKDDTRRKILIGAVVMEAIKTEKSLSKQVNQLLANRLTRDNDRKLFELPILDKKPKAKKKT